MRVQITVSEIEGVLLDACRNEDESRQELIMDLLYELFETKLGRDPFNLIAEINSRVNFGGLSVVEAAEQLGVTIRKEVQS